MVMGTGRCYTGISTGNLRRPPNTISSPDVELIVEQHLDHQLKIRDWVKLWRCQIDMWHF